MISAQSVPSALVAPFDSLFSKITNFDRENFQIS